MDFGFSKRFRNPKTLEHIAPRNGKGPCGTPRYASLNVHLGREPSRRDDLEALAYCMIYLLRGSLPWQNIATKEDIWDATYRIKAYLHLDIICQWVPVEIKAFLKYCRNLGFADEPNYKHWQDQFLALHSRHYPSRVHLWTQQHQQQAPVANPQPVIVS